MRNITETRKGESGREDEKCGKRHNHSSTHDPVLILCFVLA